MISIETTTSVLGWDYPKVQLAAEINYHIIRIQRGVRNYEREGIGESRVASLKRAHAHA